MASPDDAPEARADAVRALEAEFGELISQVRRVMAESAHQVSPGLLVGAYKAFTTIAACGEVTSSALAERLQMDKGQLSRMVRELEDLELIARSPGPHDRRSSLLRLTDHGAERLTAARALRAGMLMQSLEDWNVTDIENLTGLLHRFSTRETPAPLS